MTEQERRTLAQQQMTAYREKHEDESVRVIIRDGYTKEEAEKEIRLIEKSKDRRFDFENGDGIHFTSYTKEEMIAKIKSLIRE